MIGLVFATTEEAEPFFKAYHRGRFEGLSEGDIQHDDALVVTVTGIGKIKGTLRTERFLQQYDVDRILHVGVCSALKESFAPGTVVAANQVFEGDRIELSTPAYPRMPLEPLFETDKEGVLVTQEYVAQGDEQRSYWQRIADISDTTGYAVTYVAATHGVPCHITKVVTGVLGAGSTNFKENRTRACRVLCETLLERLPELVEA